MSREEFRHADQDLIANYFEYKIEIKKDSPEFQSLGWVDEEWWFSRMSHNKIPKELCFGAAIVLCRRGLFEMYATADCNHCNQVSHWIEDMKGEGHVNGINAPCTSCGYSVTRRPDEIRWSFKLAKHLIKDEEVYFRNSDENIDDLESMRKIPFFKRIITMMTPRKTK